MEIPLYFYVISFTPTFENLEKPSPLRATTTRVCSRPSKDGDGQRRVILKISLSPYGVYRPVLIQIGLDSDQDRRRCVL